MDLVVRTTTPVESSYILFFQVSQIFIFPEVCKIYTWIRYAFLLIEITIKKLLSQVLFPFTVGGLGMVMAGYVLDTVQRWDFFKQVGFFHL